jgi:hypothetical protein
MEYVYDIKFNKLIIKDAQTTGARYHHFVKHDNNYKTVFNISISI